MLRCRNDGGHFRVAGDDEARSAGSVELHVGLNEAKGHVGAVGTDGRHQLGHENLFVEVGHVVLEEVGDATTYASIRFLVCPQAYEEMNCHENRHSQRTASS